MDRYLLEFYKQNHISIGPLFRDSYGEKIKASSMEPKFLDHLEQVQDLRPDLIPPSDYVVEDYGIYRFFRRGSFSEAVNQGLPREVIDINNQWRKFYRSGALRPMLSMRDHYSHVRLTLNQALWYSSVL
jgi:hypothetical protein